MNIKDVISLILFFTFVISYFMKLVLLSRKNEISANVLGKGNKPSATVIVETAVKISSFCWAILWFLNSLGIGNYRSISFARPVGWMGVIVAGIGLSVFIAAMLYMKTSWRVGIDKSTETSLVTNGIYRYSRNPAFTGFDLMFIGFMMMYPNLLALIVGVSNLFFFHLLIIQEERHLKQTFGETYNRYVRDTPRYLWFI